MNKWPPGRLRPRAWSQDLGESVSALPTLGGPPPQCWISPFQGRASHSPSQWSAQPGALRGACGWVKLGDSLDFTWGLNCPGSGPSVPLSPPKPGWHRRTHYIRAEGGSSGIAIVPSLPLLDWGPSGSLRTRAWVSCFPRAQCRPRHRATHCRGQCYCHVTSLQKAPSGHPSRAWARRRKSHRG